MRTNLIFSRSANNGELTQERIRSIAPAVFATTHKDTLSDRYVPLNTSSMMPVLADFGYVPTQAVQKFGRTGVVDHKHHLVAFSHRDTLDASTSDMRPEIILYNSHDGSGAVRLFAGAFRFICSNGIIAGEGFQSRVYHSKSLSGFEEMLRGTIESLPVLMNRIEQMRNVNLSYDQAAEMAQRAANVRWESARTFAEDVQVRGTFATAVTQSDLLSVQRNEDRQQDAWTVFNRIQENVIRGNAFVKSFTDKNPDGVYRKARPVVGTAESVRVNRELWNVADEVALA